MTAATTLRRGRGFRWAVLALIVIAVLAAVSTYLTSPRPGGRMDPAATGPEGTHALVTLLRDRGVQVSVADTVTDVEDQMRPGTLLLVAESHRVLDSDLLRRLARTPGDRLVIEPTPRALAALAPAVARGRAHAGISKPDCALREVNRSGSVDLGDTATYKANGERPLIRCYGGALVRYLDGKRTVTVIGSADFMTNGTLLTEGNAALAMNLAGARPRVIWYAPQHAQGPTSDAATLSTLIPDNVTWLVIQLCLVVGLVALWKGRRLGPLVAERLPVVVRASETVEGRGRLYRSRRARDRAGHALRTATRQRLLPRLGLGATADSSAVVAAVAQRSAIPATSVQQILFGPPPATDAELLHLARALDDTERQVTHP